MNIKGYIKVCLTCKFVFTTGNSLETKKEEESMKQGLEEKLKLLVKVSNLINLT